MTSISKIALDANIKGMDDRRADLAKYQKVNKDQRSFESDGYGIKLRAFDQEHHTDEIFLANDTAEANAFLKQAMASDTAVFSQPSSGVLPYFTSVFTNKIFEQLLQTTPFFEMTESFQQGMFGSSNIFIPTVSGTGNAQPYSDQSGGGNASMNANWVNRQIVTLQRTLNYGDLEVAQMSMAKIDLVGQKREFLARNVNIDMNNIGFRGYAGMQVFGLLNDPGLNATINFPHGASGSSLWETKTANEIYADVQSLYASVLSIAAGQADLTDETILGVAPAVYTYLTTPNSLFTETVLTFLNRMFPKMKIIQVPNYQGTGTPIGSGTPNLCQLIWKKMGGQSVALNAFATLYNSHGVVRLTSHYEEKISYAPAGCIVTLPVGVATGSGC